jgi:hypothetical protein
MIALISTKNLDQAIALRPAGLTKIKTGYFGNSKWEQPNAPE